MYRCTTRCTCVYIYSRHFVVPSRVNCELCDGQATVWSSYRRPKFDEAPGTQWIIHTYDACTRNRVRTWSSEHMEWNRSISLDRSIIDLSARSTASCFDLGARPCRRPAWDKSGTIMSVGNSWWLGAARSEAGAFIKACACPRSGRGMHTHAVCFAWNRTTCKRNRPMHIHSQSSARSFNYWMHAHLAVSMARAHVYTA